MKSSLLAALAFALQAQAAPDPSVIQSNGGVAGRAFPDSPSKGYAPANVDCPQDKPTIRDASSLSPQEQAWLAGRRNHTLPAMLDFLKRINIAGFDAVTYVNNQAQSNQSNVPNVGIAISGGGYRALMNGAGFIAAADSRVAGTTNPGGIGGLLDSATYVSALSGGGWLMGSIFANNYSTVTSLRDGSAGSDVWRFDRSIFVGPEAKGISLFNTADYWINVEDSISSKRDAGYDTSITDYWGRTLSYQLINDTDGGPAYTFSSIARTPDFQSGSQPMPILVVDERSPNQTVLSINSTVLEVNPWETGSWDPTLFGFAPTEYLGTNFSQGSVTDGAKCVRGFDQYGFIMGTSSSLFNAILTVNITSVTGFPSFIVNGITDVLKALGDANNDIAAYSPNPFYGYNPATNPSATNTSLTLVDGGEDGQNIPVIPLIQPSRAVDVIFAVDSSADTANFFPDGTSVRASYERSKTAIANGTQFPAVPDNNTFINLGLNSRPTFFGCNASNFTAGQPLPPLLVYIPMAPYSFFPNVSTFNMSYSYAAKVGLIQNGLNTATMGNGSRDSEWPTCVACAMLSRSLHRTNTAVPAACSRCFDRYCWNGTVDTHQPTYNPSLLLNNGTYDGGSITSQKGSSAAAALGPANFVMLGAFGLAVLVLAL